MVQDFLFFEIFCLRVYWVLVFVWPKSSFGMPMGSRDRDHSVGMGRQFLHKSASKGLFQLYQSYNHILDGLVIDNTRLPVHLTYFKVSPLIATSLAAQFLMC